MKNRSFEQVFCKVIYFTTSNNVEKEKIIFMLAIVYSMNYAIDLILRQGFNFTPNCTDLSPFQLKILTD